MNAKTLLVGVALTMSGFTVTGPARTQAQAAARIAVEVTNNNTLDVDVFVVAGQQRIRLGSVVTGQTQTFELPAQAANAGQVRLAADPVGSRNAYLSDPVSVADGQKIRFVVAPQIAQSTVSIEASS
jgi:hypothetical protein